MQFRVQDLNTSDTYVCMKTKDFRNNELQTFKLVHLCENRYLGRGELSLNLEFCFADGDRSDSSAISDANGRSSPSNQ